jgi:cytoskeletal protein CcmA (bactofilin family)
VAYFSSVKFFTALWPLATGHWLLARSEKPEARGMIPNMKKEKNIGSISTFLGADSRIEGTIEFQGTIRLDGRVKGKILSNSGTLIVGEKALIQADIRVSSIIVMGEVSGTIDAKNRVEVYPPGRVNGDIEAGVISIEPGGVFTGNCSMKRKTIPMKKPAVPVKYPSVSELPKDQ